jgi:hypothetical protein
MWIWSHKDLEPYAPQIDMNAKDSPSVDIKLKGDGALDVHDDAPIIANLQV